MEMSPIEIPLLRESVAYSARLVDAARGFDEPSYFRHRRVNWSHRYGSGFYAHESATFRQSPEAYLAGETEQAPELEDVYAQRLGTRQLGVALAKVLAHWLFRRLGGLREGDSHAIYRKAYVDDIELVFDPAQPRVLRAVYPFPLNLRRQLRYLSFLRRERHAYRLAGQAYLPGDVLRLLVRRDVRSLMRLESRAQIRHAQEVVASGVRLAQLSDEFDIGSLDFCRRLARGGVHVVNSAHGVGKYLPVHAYQEFHVLTDKQRRYYHAVRACRYAMRPLNDRGPTARTTATPGGGIDLVFLSQNFAGVSAVVSDNEQRVLARLRDAFARDGGVRLHYKPHPNRNSAEAPQGFAMLTDTAPVNDRAGTVYVSFFSTCQIDPAFKGRKILLSGELIHPGIAFDESETILDTEGLVKIVRDAADGAPSAREPALSRETCR
jgi:hypothetical protein